MAAITQCQVVEGSQRRLVGDTFEGNSLEALHLIDTGGLPGGEVLEEGLLKIVLEVFQRFFGDS